MKALKGFVLLVHSYHGDMLFFLFIRWISCKEIDPSSIDEMPTKAIETMCLIEEHFPSSIMTIQLHALVHLVDEVVLVGTVHTRWMFFLERFMKK